MKRRDAPSGVDVTTPSVARMYDYYLGGKDNFAVDRAAAEKVIEMAPIVVEAVRANRAFLGRAVRYLAAEAGIRQFVDIGTGLPTQSNVHEIAQGIVPEARVVYVDNDPIVLAHGRALLADDASTTVIQADMRDPEGILAHPQLATLIDLTQPVAVLFVAVLHFVAGNEDAAGIVSAFRDAMPAGSHLVISHGTAEGISATAVQGAQVYDQSTTPVTLRSREEVERLFAGFELVDPGLVFLPEWRPDLSRTDDVHERGGILGGVGRKS